MAAAPLPPPGPVSTATTETPALSQGARIIDTFIAPKKTFLDIRRSAQWWLPFLLLTIAGWGLAYVAEQKVGVQKMLENDLRARPKQEAAYEKATPEQRATQIKITGIAYYVAPPIFFLLIWLILGGLQFGTLKVAASADISFGKTLAVVVYSALPIILKDLLGVLSVLAGVSPDGFTLSNPIASNPGYFMNPAENPFWYSVGSQVDLFLIWASVLTALGFATTGKIKLGTALAIVFGWWAAITLAVSLIFS